MYAPPHPHRSITLYASQQPTAQTILRGTKPGIFRSRLIGPEPSGKGTLEGGPRQDEKCVNLHISYPHPNRKEGDQVLMVLQEEGGQGRCARLRRVMLR